MSTFVIYNPVCGDGTAKELFDEHVLPLIEKSSKVIDSIIVTESQGYAATVLREHFAKDAPITVVLGAGDGTLHEIIDAVPDPRASVAFALVPCGTANALYSSLFPVAIASAGAAGHADAKLKSLQAFLAGAPSRPLTLALTTLSGHPRPVVSAVVASTALHAAILHDSEALRVSTPGIERFKAAALANITRWYRATARLHGHVQVYDAGAGAFVDCPEEPLVLEGPFVYFLSTVNVDRLEPYFRIAPLHADIVPSEAAFDIVVVRPLRSPAISEDSEDSRKACAPQIGAVLQAAYRNGAHVKMRYAEDGTSVGDEGTGPTVVEYFRCSGWEWEPDESDERAHLVCADGDILHIDKGGKATSVAKLSRNDNCTFSVFA